MRKGARQDTLSALMLRGVVFELRYKSRREALSALFQRLIVAPHYCDGKTLDSSRITAHRF
jgi:hypothetical protein